MNSTAMSSATGRGASWLARAILGGALLVMPACAIPPLQPPDAGTPVPADFRATPNTGAPPALSAGGDSSAQVGVSEFFNDPKLTSLIATALTDNQELKILAQDIQIANNEVLARRGAYLPFVTIGGGAGLERTSRFTRNGAVESQLLAAPDRTFPNPLPNFLIAANFSWQLDIWRQLRNARDAASLRLLATNEGRNYVVTRLVSEVAENYYGLMALDKRLETLDKTIALQEKSLEMAKDKKAAGTGTELGVQRFQAEVRKNQSEKLLVAQEIVETENRINFLAGRYPQPVERATSEFVDLELTTLSAGLPAQLLQNRPDVRQAERELEACGLDVKVARARFYPTPIITAGLGYEAFNPRYFTDPEALVGNLVGNLVGPVVNRKAIQADYLTANARQLQAVYNYQRTVLNAFTEVVNRLSMVENYRKSIEVKRQQVKALEASVEAANDLFKAARVEYIEVLFAQREMMDARLVLIDTKRQQLAAIAGAYQALGGGSPASVTVPPPR